MQHNTVVCEKTLAQWTGAHNDAVTVPAQQVDYVRPPEALPLRHFHCESLSCSSESYGSRARRLSVLKLCQDSDESAIDEERSARNDAALLQRVDLLRSMHMQTDDLRQTTTPLNRLHSRGAFLSPLENELTGSRSDSDAPQRQRDEQQQERQQEQREQKREQRERQEQQKTPPFNQISVPVHSPYQEEKRLIVVTDAGSVVNNRCSECCNYHDASHSTRPAWQDQSTSLYQSRLPQRLQPGSTLASEGEMGGASLQHWQQPLRHVLQSLDGQCCQKRRQQWQQVDPNCLPKRVLANIVAYWLSLKYEQTKLADDRADSQHHSLNDLCLPPTDTFVPAYLRDGTYLKQTLTDICWSSGARALDRVAAVHIAESIGAYSSPAHLQSSLQRFINTIGAAAIQSYLETSTDWIALTQRYRCLLSPRCGSVGKMLETMSISASV